MFGHLPKFDFNWINFNTAYPHKLISNGDILIVTCKEEHHP